MTRFTAKKLRTLERSRGLNHSSKIFIFDECLGQSATQPKKTTER